ncbi:hypothetical protein DRN73_06450 [Candidatus Pacearchaeota archaeon]|nr:MAG: hypothetical protein DRN73_06450 [Candidatus Pacearchaeota archaeon]
MLLQETSEKFKELFLLAFTKELILHSGDSKLLELKNKVEEKKQNKKQEVKELVKEELIPKKIMFKPLPKPFKPLPKRLIIPPPRFPLRLQYIKPTPTPTPLKLDLGKLNPLIQDPLVQTIECQGPDKKIIVRTPRERKTEISLTKQEIDDIIDKFSKQAKIPVEEGIFRVVVGNLNLSAIISNIIGTKFIIKKLKYFPIPRKTSNLIPGAFTQRFISH